MKHIPGTPYFNTPEGQREYRKRRRAEGRPLKPGSETWDEKKKAAWKVAYYSDPAVKARKAAQMREYTKAHGTREHHLARWQVSRAIVTGAVVRQPCEVCGLQRSEAHHDDYSKPLQVRWLCRTHHREHHAKATQS